MPTRDPFQVLLYHLLSRGAFFVGITGLTSCAVAADSCGVTNCHGLEVTCGPNPVEACTMIYTVGDGCRQLARCVAENGACVVQYMDGYDECKRCVTSCRKRFARDPSKLFECDSRCSVNARRKEQQSRRT